MAKKFNNRTRVMGNGELYSIKNVYKLVKEFESMNWIEQQSFLTGIRGGIGIATKIKRPPNECWTKEIVLTENINKDFA